MGECFSSLVVSVSTLGEGGPMFESWQVSVLMRPVGEPPAE